MRATLAGAVVLAVLCALTCCTWLDHFTNASLTRELIDRSAKEGLALARFTMSGASLEVRFFDGRKEVLPLPWCPTTIGRSISRNRLVMVDVPCNPPSAFQPMGTYPPLLFGPLIAMNPRGRRVAVSEVALGPYFATMSPDEKRFAFLGIPKDHTVADFGIYVAGFHDKELRKIVDVGLPRQRNYMDVTTKTILDWAADSENLLFSNEQTVSLVNASTGTVRKLADGGGAQGSPPLTGYPT